MTGSRCVVVTGTNKAGKSIVIEDARVTMTGAGNFDLWQTKPGQSPHDELVGHSPLKFFPGPGVRCSGCSRSHWPIQK